MIVVATIKETECLFITWWIVLFWQVLFLPYVSTDSWRNCSLDNTEIWILNTRTMKCFKYLIYQFPCYCESKKHLKFVFVIWKLLSTMDPVFLDLCDSVLCQNTRILILLALTLYVVSDPKALLAAVSFLLQACMEYYFYSQYFIYQGWEFSLVCIKLAQSILYFNNVVGLMLLLNKIIPNAIHS